MSYITDITSFTTSSISYQTGDYPASIAISYPGDQPGFGSYGFNNYRTGAGLNMMSLCFELGGICRSGGYLMYWPYTNTSCYCGPTHYRVATLLNDSSIYRTTGALNFLDGTSASPPDPDPNRIGAPLPEPVTPWKDSETTPIQSGDPSNNPSDPVSPDDGGEFPPTSDPYPIPPIGPEVPA